MTRSRGVCTPVRACCALSVLSVALLGCVGCAPAAGRGAGPGPHPVYVRGAGRIADDWSDEGRLSTARHGRSDLVALWQAVLWADGYLLRSRVDCRFGRATYEATRSWQNNHGLTPDGIVGAKTFGSAGSRLVRRSGLVVYRGEEHDLPMRRGRDGRYSAEDAGQYTQLRADRATLRVCA